MNDFKMQLSSSFTCLKFQKIHTTDFALWHIFTGLGKLKRKSKTHLAIRRVH
jgi:hypothetical protein